MKLQSTHTPKAYIMAMKQRMGSRFAFWSERFTGTFIGRLFYVTHHAGYEWDRRITNQKNAALGYLRKTENGSEVRFLLFQGVLCPQYLIFYLLILGMYLLGTWPAFWEAPLLMIFCILIILSMPLLATFFETLTDGSIEGRKNLLGLLADPSDPFAYLNHQRELR